MKRDITTQDTLAALYEAFDKLNKHYFNDELPTVCLIISDMTRRYSHGWFTVSKIWTDGRDSHKMHEIALSASLMEQGMHMVIGVLLHEMIHLFCSVNKIKDTSNGVTYHNSKFKTESEKRGLVFIQTEVCKVNGWYETALSENAELVVDGFNLNVNAFAISRDFVDTLSSHSEEEEKEVPKIEVMKKVRKKNSEYSCPSCDLKFKAKDTLNIICGHCEVSLDENYFI